MAQPGIEESQQGFNMKRKSDFRTRDQPDSSDMKVGYANPPHHARFKPGVSGNPKGRPKWSEDGQLGQLLGREIYRPMGIQENGRRLSMPAVQIGVRRLAIAAAKGDPSNPPEGTSVHRKLPKVKRVQTDDERVDEDLSVAKFYLNDENYQGAYLRAKDAVNIQPEFSAAHFTLAEIAQKMKKKDEAIAEFQTYLKLDPEGEKAKAAKKALAELQ